MSGELGFSWIGAVFLLALFVPNLLWATRARPTGYDPSTENRVLVTIERVGQVATTACAVLLLPRPRGAILLLWLAIALMAAYELCWLRYFRGSRTVRDFYRPLGPVPVPLASLPVAAFILLGLWARLPVLMGSAVVLGVGHIGIHLQHLRALRGAHPERDGR